MRRRLWFPIGACVLLVGCDIDFVALDDTDYGAVMLRSEHVTAFGSSLEVALPGGGAPPLVRVDGAELRGEQMPRGWRFRSAPPVDSLQPRLELAIQGQEPFLLVLPLVARNGAAAWQADGSLTIPMVYGGDPGGWDVTWETALVDARGRPLLAIHSRAAPISSPLVLHGELVPAGAVTAQVSAVLHRQFTHGEYPLNAVVFSHVRVPIPRRD